jgi:predicted DCC family thiol-disulfide oxidoreductase YuxK
MKQGSPLFSHEWDKYEKVIVFDGVCNFCNAFVNFVMDQDSQEGFKFATLQSEPAQKILTRFQLSTEDYETFLLLEAGKVFTKSTAALKILRRLNGLWPLLYIFMIIPRPIRDTVYSFIARHRYGWMGKTASCRVPTAKDRQRFV